MSDNDINMHLKVSGGDQSKRTIDENARAVRGLGDSAGKGAGLMFSLYAKKTGQADMKQEVDAGVSRKLALALIYGYAGWRGG